MRRKRRWVAWAAAPLALVGALAGIAVFVGSCLFAAPGYRGPRSDHFDGERFFNQQPVKAKTFGDLLRWRRQRHPGPWRAYRHHAPGPPPPARVGPGELRVTFVNHATVLLQIDGVNLLTDPIWSRRASPVSYSGPERARNPGLRFRDLPPIHAVLVSHNHYDHLDLPTLRRLHRAHRPLVLAGLGNRRLLLREGVPRSVDLDWWQSAAVDSGVRVHFVPAQHWSQRGLGDRNKTLWGGFVVVGSRHRVYFAGDTGFGPHFAEVRRRFGPVDLALLPIGAYKPRWFMRDMHMDPWEAVRAHRVLEARRSVGIHFGTFPLADDGQDDPPQDLARALEAARLPATAFGVLGFGEGRDIPATSAPRARPSPLVPARPRQEADREARGETATPSARVGL